MSSTRSRAGRPRRLRAVAVIGVAVFAAVALVTGLWALPGTLFGSGEDVTPEVAAEAEEGDVLRISNIEVPGPAVGETISTPNRLGSASIPVRAYEPEDPWGTLVWAHGGSFVHGTLDWPEADWVSRQFAEAGLRVYSVDYVLASDTVKAPAPANDVAAVLAWAADETGPLIIGGASAGAHLATLAALAQAEAAADGDGARAADALILEYPTLHRVQRADAAVSAATAGLPDQRRFGPERIAEMYDFYLGIDGGPGGGADAPGAPAAQVPVIAGELPEAQLALLPPTVIVNADADDLRASGEEFAEQLRSAGVPVAEHVQPGTIHGYTNRPDESPQARADAEATIERFVAELRVFTSS